VFPVPWADTPSISFLATPQEAQSLVTSAGFELIQWEDRTQEAVEFFKAGAAARRPALGIQVYVPDLAVKSRNLVHNFENDRLRVSQAIFRAV
jgi:sarcosine/dimethylglycine N-methyltransferase